MFILYYNCFMEENIKKERKKKQIETALDEFISKMPEDVVEIAHRGSILKDEFELADNPLRKAEIEKELEEIEEHLKDAVSRHLAS